jgi:hypothetical protein
VEEREQQALAQLSPNDLSALSTILQFYERFLWNMTAPSAKRSKQIVEVQLLIVKLFQLPKRNAMVLTLSEVGYINSALQIFLSQVKQKIPPSRNRDEVLESCEWLREYMGAVFAHKQA